MEAKNQSELVKKYWKGESSVEEEKELLKSNLSHLEVKENTHFQQIRDFSKMSLGPDFEAELMAKIKQESTPVRQLHPRMLLRVAAAVLVCVSMYFLYQPLEQTTEETQLAALEEDPEKAFEITKQALLLVSAKLNKASKVALPLDKFEETQTKIKDRN